MTIDELTLKLGLVPLPFQRPDYGAHVPAGRGTGRTTKMLLAACLDVMNGSPVMIVANHKIAAQDYASRLQSWVRRLGGQPRLVQWSVWPYDKPAVSLGSDEALFVNEVRNTKNSKVTRRLVQIIDRLTRSEPPVLFEHLRGRDLALRIYCDNSVDDAFGGRRPSLDPIGRKWAN